MRKEAVPGRELCTQGAARGDAASGEAIGIIGAMEIELRLLKESAAIQRTVLIAGMEFCEGRMGNKRVVIVKCGMGKVNAGICANTLINSFGCTRIVNTGVAGSLDNRIDIGDIVVSVDAVQHDFDVSPIGFAKGEIPYTGLYAFPADGTLRAAAAEAVRTSVPGVRVYEGRICSGDRFICTKEQKDRIITDFGGLCCEMEGAAVAQACFLNGVPFVILRAISDKLDGSSAMEFNAFAETAAHSCAESVRAMIGLL